MIHLIHSFMCQSESKAANTFDTLHTLLTPDSFLESSTLLITERETLTRHSLAAIRCLLASQKIFAPSYAEADRDMGVIRGTYGFYGYAAEIWIDNFLDDLEIDQDLSLESRSFELSCRLAEQFGGIESNEIATANSLSDPRLVMLRQKHPFLHNVVQGVLLERNKTTIEENGMHTTKCLSLISSCALIIQHEYRSCDRQQHYGKRRNGLDKKIQDDNSQTSGLSNLQRRQFPRT
jgi:hypothetical protein